MANEEKAKTNEEVEKKEQKTIGDYGYVRVNIFADEFKDIGISETMFSSEASNIVRENLGLKLRSRSRNPLNALLVEAKSKAKDEGKLEELQKVVEKFLKK